MVAYVDSGDIAPRIFNLCTIWSPPVHSEHEDGFIPELVSSGMNGVISQCYLFRMQSPNRLSDPGYYNNNNNNYNFIFITESNLIWKNMWSDNLMEIRIFKFPVLFWVSLGMVGGGGY
jgi:hypothetical protein